MGCIPIEMRTRGVICLLVEIVAYGLECVGMQCTAYQCRCIFVDRAAYLSVVCTLMQLQTKWGKINALNKGFVAYSHTKWAG